MRKEWSFSDSERQFSQAFQSCKLLVQRKILITKIWIKNERNELLLLSSKILRYACQKCFLRVRRNFLGEKLKNLHVSKILMGLWRKNCKQDHQKGLTRVHSKLFEKQFMGNRWFYENFLHFERKCLELETLKTLNFSRTLRNTFHHFCENCIFVSWGAFYRRKSSEKMKIKKLFAEFEQIFRNCFQNCTQHVRRRILSWFFFKTSFFPQFCGQLLRTAVKKTIVLSRKRITEN